ncbi:MAG: hypothetical protein ACI4XC_07910 [Eubacterium sp.]
MKIKDSLIIRRLFLSAICFFALSVFLFCTDNGLFALLMLLIAVLIFIIGIIRLINADKKDKSTKGAPRSNHEDIEEYSLDLSKEDIERWNKIHEEKQRHEEIEKEKRLHQILTEFGIKKEDIEPLTNDGIKRNYHDGVYHCDKTAKYGSVDNPIVVGIPEYSNSLVFIPERGGWCLTDGLGNGWIR